MKLFASDSERLSYCDTKLYFKRNVRKLLPALQLSNYKRGFAITNWSCDD
jgi:hypothetical protein